MNIKIGIAAHKVYRMPSEKSYLPIQVGAHGKDDIGYTRDDIGDNISEKNPYYCELTGLYWMWKNLDVDYCGLVHYRRYFARKRFFRFDKDKFKYILTDNDLKNILSNHDIILPQRRRYYIESLYSHYAHTHYAEHLDVTREILRERCPDYVDAYDNVIKKTSGHMFNMMIMKKNIMDSYCEWLFPILSELEKKIDSSGYSTFQARYYGRVSEILINVWIEKNKYKYYTCPTVNIEKLDWNRKIKSFINAKFRGIKYDSSF